MKGLRIGYRVIESHREVIDGQEVSVVDTMDLLEVSTVFVPDEEDDFQQNGKLKSREGNEDERKNKR